MYRVLACLTDQHDWRLVALAAFVCLLTCLAAIKLFHSAQASREHHLRWLCAAALVTGYGIWATHFIAVLAYEPAVSVGYDLWGTFASLVLAVVLTGAGYRLALQRMWTAAGLMIGLAIAMMHFVGMWSLAVPGRLTWSTDLVVISVAFGGALSAGSLAIAGRGTDLFHSAVGGLLLLGAIVGLHFTAMAAVGIELDPTIPVSTISLSEEALSAMIAIAALGVIGISLVATMAEISRSEIIAAKHAEIAAQAAQLQTIVDNFPGGISMTDRDLRVTLTNKRLRDLLDLPEEMFAAGAPKLEDVLRFNAKRGEYGAGDVEALVGQRMALLRERRAHAHERTRPDGRVVEVRSVPVENGGFVTTYIDVTDRRRNEERIVHLSRHDALTHLPNRTQFNERLQEALGRAVRDRPLALHLIDLDRFKFVNDTLGHPVGDRLLCEVADRLRTCLRQSDAVARLGGDEFAIVHADLDSAEDAGVLAQRVIDSLSAPYTIDGHELRIGASVGIALAPGDASTIERLMRCADLALYRAKDSGRGHFQFFDVSLDDMMQQRRALEMELRAAVTTGQLELHYQPILQADRRTVACCEALMRWRHPDRGLISPAEFIPLAEETALIVPMGEWAIRTACKAAKTWPSHISVAVNLSPVQFRRPGLVDAVAQALEVSGLEPGRLELEVTESLLLENGENSMQTFEQLRKLGVVISLDDFGTGYSSLGYLRRFPFQKLKIDREFIKDLKIGDSSSAIIDAISGLARALDITTVAEGVETEQQAYLLKAAGCEQFQGFLMSRPLIAADLNAYLSSQAESSKELAA